MKQARLLYVLIGMLFVAHGAFAGALEEVGEDVGSDLEKVTEDDMKDLSQADREALEGAMQKFKEGDAKDLQQFMQDHQAIMKDNLSLENKLESAMGNSERSDLLRTGVVGKENLEALTSKDLIPKDIDPNNPESMAQAREDYGNIARTKNLVDKTESRLQDIASDVRKSQEKFGTRMQEFTKEPTVVAKKYLTELDGVTKKTLDRLGVDAQGLDKIKDWLGSDDPVLMRKGCREAAKLEGLRGIGDLDNVAEKFVANGAKKGMSDAMVNQFITKADASFDELSSAIEKDPEFFTTTSKEEAGEVEVGAKGGEHQAEPKVITTSKFSKFLDQSESSLSKGITQDADKYTSECDIALDKVEKDAKIGFFERRAIKLRAFLRSPLSLIKESFDTLATDLKSTSRYDLGDSVISGAKGGFSKTKGIFGKLGATAEQLVSAVVFMVPNVFQSTFMAAQQKAALAKTYFSPIKYGDKVYQIPDSCANLSNPAGSWPIYVQIPVNNVGDTVSSDLSSIFAGSISGPTSNNLVSQAIHDVGAAIFSFGTVFDTSVRRYNIDEKTYLPLTDIMVMYGAPGSYVATGTEPLTSSQFTGQIISLRTGSVSDATGDVVNATGLVSGCKSVPLIDVKQPGALSIPQTAPFSQLQTIYQTLPAMLSKQELASAKTTFTQYSNFAQGTTGKTLSVKMRDLFDTSCVTSRGALSAPDCSCVIVEGLESIGGGIAVPAQGAATASYQVDTQARKQYLQQAQNNSVIQSRMPAQSIVDTRVAVAATARQSKILGRLAPSASATTTSTPQTSSWDGFVNPIIPVFGWGENKKYASIINESAFPGFKASSTGVSGIIRAGKIGDSDVANTAGSTVVDAGMQFAPEDESWAARGCWIYVSVDTPLVKDLTQGFTGNLSAYGSYVDYVVFLDENANIVPLMVPVDVTVEYGNQTAAESFVQSNMYVNPAIKYWTSLVTYDSPLYMVNNVPVMYDFVGNRYPYAGLTTPAAGSQGQQGVIGTFMAAIQQGFPLIYNQVQMHIAALQARLNNMPIRYANCTLSTAAEYDLSISGGTIQAYTGLNCYKSSVQDVLFAVNNYPLTDPGLEFLALPNASARYLISAVTDIAYKLSDDNRWVPIDLSNSIINNVNNVPTKTAKGALSIDVSKESQFYFLSGMLSGKIPSALLDYVQAQRALWIKNMQVVADIGSGAQAATCTLAQGIEASDNKYVYQINPSLSASICMQQDYFIAVNSQVPQLSSLKPVNLAVASVKGANLRLVSLLTGVLYDSNGVMQTYSNGLPRRIGGVKQGIPLAQQIFDVLSAQKLPAAFIANYQQSVKDYIAASQNPMGPYSFGHISIAIRQGDMLDGSFVYFNANSMNSSELRPRDLYVVVEQANNQFNIATYDATKTQYLLSLMTGMVYDRNGHVYMNINPTTLATIVADWKKGWSSWILSNLAQLQVSYKEKQQRYLADEQRTQQELQSFINQNNSSKNINQAKIAAIISNLKTVQVPFSMLMYDPKTETYVHPSPAGSSIDDGLLYMMLDTGKIYRQDGSFASQVPASVAQAMRDQFGVVIDAQTGKQKLGIPMFQPSLVMDPSEVALTPGASGPSLIVGTDINFPGNIVQLKKGYFLYYSKIMDNYYVFDVKNNQWMSVVGGHLYQKNGQPVAERYKVAMRRIDGAESVPMLLYTYNGLYQAYMSDGSDYSNISDNNTNMTWMSLSGLAQLAVTADAKGTTFTVNKNEYYQVDPSYYWTSCVQVPITANGSYMKNIPDDADQFVKLVFNKNVLAFALYNDQMYRVQSAVGDIYTLSPMSSKTGKQISITVGLVDEETKVSYVTLTDNNVTLKYAYQPKLVDKEAQSIDRNNIWKGITAACPLSLPVGPMHQKSKDVDGQTYTVTVPDGFTHVAFTQDLPKEAFKNVVIKDVVDAPQDPTMAALLSSSLTNVFKTEDNRFVSAIGGSTASNNPPGILTFTYVLQPAYVDLENGALYDKESGVALGQCLNLEDYLKVLDACRVVVARTAKSTKAVNVQLRYRSANVMRQQVTQEEEAA